MKEINLITEATLEFEAGGKHTGKPSAGFRRRDTFVSAVKMLTLIVQGD